MTNTQNLPQFSLKYHPIHPGIHKDLSIGTQTSDAYDTLMAARVVAGTVSWLYLNEPEIIQVRILKRLGKGSLGGVVKEFCRL